MTKTNLSYLNTTDDPQDLVTITASIDQIYDILPEGKAREHAKQVKNTLAKDKQKGAIKAKDEMDIVEEALDFREADLSVSYTSRLVTAALEDLSKEKNKEASDALSAVANGVMFVDTTVIDPMDIAARRVWMETQDYANKDYKAAKAKLEKAKSALQEVALSGNSTLQAGAKQLINKIGVFEVMKEGDKTAAAALDALWQGTERLLDQPVRRANK